MKIIKLLLLSKIKMLVKINNILNKDKLNPKKEGLSNLVGQSLHLSGTTVSLQIEEFLNIMFIMINMLKVIWDSLKSMEFIINIWKKLFWNLGESGHQNKEALSLLLWALFLINTNLKVKINLSMVKVIVQKHWKIIYEDKVIVFKN